MVGSISQSIDVSSLAGGSQGRSGAAPAPRWDWFLRLGHALQCGDDRRRYPVLGDSAPTGQGLGGATPSATDIARTFSTSSTNPPI